MTDCLPVGFAEGTHRTTTPSQTLAWIAPALPLVGITRTADITGLDRVGIPTWCAVRPAGRILQISNGKGCSHLAAKVSALMEAIELWHAENPEARFRRASAAELECDGLAYASAASLPEYPGDLHLTDRRVIDWVEAELLPEGTPVWLPASAAFLVDPMLSHFSTNGLASGNHRVEAILHGLYEVIERDAMSKLIRGGLCLPRGESRVVDLDTVPAGIVAALRDRLRCAGVVLTLVRVQAVVPVCTFWAVILDVASGAACSYVNMGHGSHLCPTVAAVRAITEAAQSRLAFIHGSREDLSPGSYLFNPAHERLRRFFGVQRGELPWDTIIDRSTHDLALDLQTVLSDLRAEDYGKVYCIDLTRPECGIPVVKVIVPGFERAAV